MSNNNEQPYHPLSNYFPLMRGEEFQDLVADIAENGLHEPIVRYEGKILDGRNRWRACKEAGVTPEFRDYEGGSPVSYVISMNARRRHMEPAQLALCVREMKDDLQAEARERMEWRRNNDSPSHPGGSGVPEDERGRWTEKAAEAAGVGDTTVQRVDRVAREAEDPDSPFREEAEQMVEEIRSGELGAKPAEQRLKRMKEEREREQENARKSESERRAEAAREALAEAEDHGDAFRASLQDLVQEGHTDYLGAGDAAKIGSILQQVSDAARRLYDAGGPDLLDGEPADHVGGVEVGA